MGSRRIKGAFVAALTVVSLAGIQTIASAQHDDPTIVYELQSPVQSTPEETWQGDLGSGSNVNYDFTAGEPCVEDHTGQHPEYCDIRLLRVTNANVWQTQGGGIQIVIDHYSPNAESDFDLQVFASDAQGRKGRLVASSGNSIGEPERVIIKEASGYYRIQVVYFAVVTSRYEGHITTFTRARAPRDVDNPPGLQDIVASNVKAGWRSRSEMHLAQNPINRNMLVAGSKFYNKDRDSLEEYEFKVGSYVSFTGGRSWADLGQTRTCPQNQAPPSSWPDNNCYPADNPSRGGTGDEDVKEGQDDIAFDNRGTGDFGEEYIVSDPWLQFDDEGNAYYMVLDAPPFESGVGWGMSFHRWESVSRRDVREGRTWGPSIPINQYPDAGGDLKFLDDKNTFAVNNAGPDRDGQTGIMVACWGQNIAQLIKQQIVCERSIDGGRTWPDQPTPISGVHQLVIGVHVIADKTNPLTFYAVWLQYESPSRQTLEFNMTTDGGETWLPQSRPIDLIRQIPRQFPDQGFRNLSIPIMAVSPDPDGPSGSQVPSLYVTVAEYLASDEDEPENEDDREADVMLLKSVDRGVTWTKQNLTDNDGPNKNADQFQPYVDVSETGQVNVFYFDRRHDVPTKLHPGNYFVDTYLSRSNDGGQTWTDIRVSHDSTDPEYNAPVSSSGLFFGDYQGLVSDNCATIPFVNDTHLANDRFLDPGPERDPGFDEPDDRFASPFQQAITWRVPNTANFGGNGMPDLTPTKITSSETPTRGNQTTLRATVRNLECIGATNVVVQFRDNGQPIGSKTIPSIPGGAARVASIQWTPRTAGPHEITVIVDPNNNNKETNEGNNTKSRTFNVRRGGGGDDDGGDDGGDG